MKLKDKGVEGMVLINSGYFQMGDTFGDGDNDEKPVHKVNGQVQALRVNLRNMHGIEIIPAERLTR